MSPPDEGGRRADDATSTRRAPCPDGHDALAVLEDTLSSSIGFAHAGVACLTNRYEPGDPKLIAARRNLTTLVMRQDVEKALAAAPPLTDEQRESIIAPLRAGNGAA